MKLKKKLFLFFSLFTIIYLVFLISSPSNSPLELLFDTLYDLGIYRKSYTDPI